MQAKPKLNVFLCAPRGFCAGVVRAIEVVEHALRKFGAPVYVRHEIVHNRYVVDGLKAKGAIFVEELSEVPDDGAPVVFSAHGVPKAVPEEAEGRRLLAIDATCPLVTKVHREAEIHFRRNRKVVLVGHKGHPEVIGTMGQLPDGAVTLVESAGDVEALTFAADEALAYVTQTTLSVDDMAVVVNALREKYPEIVGPHRQDICYATTNRQEAVKEIAHNVDAFIVVGSPNSSNSQRLKEVAERSGCRHAQLVLRATDIDWAPLQGIKSLGVTAGASAPEILVEEILDAFAERVRPRSRHRDHRDGRRLLPPAAQSARKGGTGVNPPRAAGLIAGRIENPPDALRRVLHVASKDVSGGRVRHVPSRHVPSRRGLASRRPSPGRSRSRNKGHSPREPNGSDRDRKPSGPVRFARRPDRRGRRPDRCRRAAWPRRQWRRRGGTARRRPRQAQRSGPS